MAIDVTWYKGFTLSERLQLLREKGDALPRLPPGASPVADQRIERWRTQEPFTQQDIFTRRLAQATLDDDEFRYLLAAEVEAFAGSEPDPSTWAGKLGQAFRDDALPARSKASEEQGAIAFLGAFHRLITPYRNQLLSSIRALKQRNPSAPFEPQEVEEALWQSTTTRLGGIISRTMVLELQVARLQGLLHGETPEERFQSFIHYISQEQVMLALLKEYPVLARVLTTCVEDWMETSLEFLERLCKDWASIVHLFAEGEHPGVLVKISVSGDYHRQGRAVALLDFSSGFRLVYKPKSLDADEHFQALLCWLNERGQEPRLRPTRMLNRGAYGWCEFLSFQPCSSVEEVARFYQREAGLLALLYVLAATDFHYENIIAVGEYPMLVDYESLFHPVLPTSASDTDEWAISLLIDTVFSVGLLPRRSWGNEEFAGVNLSGLGGDFTQLSPREGAYWLNAGTDEMYFGRKRSPIAGKAGHNLPLLHDEYISVLEQREAFLTGFTSTYRLLLQHRADLLAADGPLAGFAENELRLLIRPTHIYSLMLRESYHPDLLRDALERDRFFDKLWKPVQLAPLLPQFIPFEQTDLWRNEYPIFYVRPCSRHIWSSTGACLENTLRISGMDRVRQRIEHLSEADLKWQDWIIRASLTVLDINTTDTSARRRSPLPDAETLSSTALRAKALQSACTVGDRLVELARRNNGLACWLGLQAFQERYWDVSLLDLRLYAGLPGVALFLAYLGDVTGEKHYSLLAQETLAHIRLQLRENSRALHSTGAFNGYGGLIYTFTHLAVLWNDASLFTDAEKLIDQMATLVEKDQKFDIIDGAAGCIGSLFSLYEHRPSERLVEVMIQCGDVLLRQAQHCATGIGWVTPLSSQPLSGFAHGSAGIAWALLRLGAITRMPRFTEAALATLAYERSLFSAEQKNWSDLRTPESPSCMTAWCHGAAGIGLARLSSLPYLDTIEVRDEIAQAITTTLATGFGHNHSLCHGDAGNLELLLLAAQTLQDPELTAETYRVASGVLASIEQDGWLCGVPLNVENPGFMAGLAGIGYGLLRLADLEAIPSVLVLEGPKRRLCA